jgi:predicted unusual protein kinase regulating ubiquinone biosynthesis (AarF/ABC1/UbiB family)
MKSFNSDIKIPENYLDLCKEKVIVMEFVDGVPIMDVKQLREKNYDL